MAGEELLSVADMLRKRQLVLFDRPEAITRKHQKRKFTRRQTTAEIIKAMPPGTWRLPITEWLLGMKRNDGDREYRTVRGTLQDVRDARTAAFATGRYQGAFFTEIS